MITITWNCSRFPEPPPDLSASHQSPLLGEAKGIVWFQSSIIFPSVVLWSFNYLHLRRTEHSDAIKHLGFLFQGCQKSPGWVDRRPIVHIDLCLLLWTIKATCHTQTRQKALWFLGYLGMSRTLIKSTLGLAAISNSPYHSEVLNQRPFFLCLNWDKNQDSSHRSCRVDSQS